MTLADLNQFTLLGVEQTADHALLTGRLSLPGACHVGEGIRLFLNLEEDVPGDIVVIDPDAGTVVLRVRSEDLRAEFMPGVCFPVYSEYWHGAICLVLAANRRWVHTRFVAPDAFVRQTPSGWREWRVLQPGDENRTDGKIVPGGWDHEHCELCWRHIGSGGDPEGYVNEQGQWVCVGCYARYVEPRDLRFVREGAERDTEEPITESNKAFAILSDLMDKYDLESIRSFLDRHRYADLRSRNGWTPLMVAAFRGHKSIVALLLTHGADVNEAAECTPLAIAAQAGHLEVTQLLLAAGASVQVPGSLCGGSLLAHVLTGGQGESGRIYRLLKEAGAK